MVQIKPRDTERYLKKPDSRHRTILVYGPDRGLVSERADILARASGIAADDPFATVLLDADETAADPNRLLDEANTVSMFGSGRLIRLRGSTQKNLAKAVRPLLTTPPLDSLIIIEAGDLKKSSPLRNDIEKSPNAAAIPCYVDQGAMIESIIMEEVKSCGLTIADDARRALQQSLGGDRLASRSEIQKLCLYCLNDGKITVEDVESIIGDAASLAMDNVIDAAFVGDTAIYQREFRRLISSGINPVAIASAGQRHAQMLHQLRCRMSADKSSAQTLVGSLRPPVHFKRRDAIIAALGRWSGEALGRVLSRLDETSLKIRERADLAEPLLSTAFLAISIEAARTSRH